MRRRPVWILSRVVVTIRGPGAVFWRCKAVALGPHLFPGWEDSTGLFPVSAISGFISRYFAGPDVPMSGDPGNQRSFELCVGPYRRLHVQLPSACLPYPCMSYSPESNGRCRVYQPPLIHSPRLMKISPVVGVFVLDYYKVFWESC